ncbi:hypothetical protein ACJ73_01046 [Blastomyces percursus]|uniref:Uncharacterized protein n=1 Tax=Blastomyces percursus TaxID=1658174 RepID=A0A1J9RG65_9EURO|nr:hypothetical protein ACJ73_01046 [Blastomyces percursus]
MPTPNTANRELGSHDNGPQIKDRAGDTQIIANATSVTLNRLSTSQSAAAPLTIAAVHPSCQN